MKTINLAPLTHPVKKKLKIPGSKSYMNRALLLSAYTRGPVKIKNPIICEDTKAMLNALQTLGIEIQIKAKSVVVIGDIWQIKNKKYTININLSGTSLRFLLPLLTITPGIKVLKGKMSIEKRPVSELVDALCKMGANIEYLKNKGFPPLKIASSSLNKNTIKIRGDISSQFISAILMIGPFIGNLKIDATTDQISSPYIDMTLSAMKYFGIKVINNNYKSYRVPAKQKYQTSNYRVEGDYSSASYFFAIAVLTESEITVTNLNPNSLQADKNLLTEFKKMGAEIVYGHNYVTVKGHGVKPVEVDLISFPDQAQTLAVIAAFANGKTYLKGLRSLKIKETDRLKATVSELAKMGIKTTYTGDSMTIYGGNPHSAKIKTYNDHRMAMSFAIAGSKLGGMVIENPQVVNKSYPTFWEDIKKLGVKLKKNNN